MQTVETFGVVLPDSVVEAVAPLYSDDLSLHVLKSGRFQTTDKFESGDTVYIAPKIGRLTRFVRFAPASSAFGSPSDLVQSLLEFFSTHACLEGVVVDLLAAFAKSTWHCDSLPEAPLLNIFGPDDAISEILRLLDCVCRRPIIVGDVDRGGLAMLPAGLGATILLNQLDLGRGVRRTLLASSRRYCHVLRNSGSVDLYGARAFACDDFSTVERGLRVSLSPTEKSLPPLTDAEVLRISQDLQAKMLRSRMINYAKVRDCHIDCQPFAPELRSQAHAWLAPICDCPELTSSVIAEFQRQGEELAGARLFDPRSLVIEAALFFCHKPVTDRFRVGELTDALNALLIGRHEKGEFSPKKIGSVLRGLGFSSERGDEGYRVVLTDATREKIHRLAAQYRVASWDGVRRCAFCPGEQSERVSENVLLNI